LAHYLLGCFLLLLGHFPPLLERALSFSSPCVISLISHLISYAKSYQLALSLFFRLLLPSLFMQVLNSLVELYHLTPSFFFLDVTCSFTLSSTHLLEFPKRPHYIELAPLPC
jgi:hypothetical protein